MSCVESTSWTLNALLTDWVSDSLPDTPVGGVSVDSRLIERGDLYLAVDGSVTHGMRYAQAAVDAGAAAVLIASDDVDTFGELIETIRNSGVPVVAVDDLASQCADIAARFYGYPDRSMTLIAVTGTDGKTSVCRFIAQAFSAAGKRCGYIGTLGWGLGDALNSTELTTPDVVSLRRMLASLQRDGAELVALEASSHGLAEQRLKELSIDVAVLTNLGRDHLDYHKTVEHYKASKASLFSWPGLTTMVLNEGDSFGRELLADKPSSTRQIAYKTECLGANVESSSLGRDDVLSLYACDVTADDTGLSFTLSEGGHSAHVSTSLLGQFNVDNLLACYASLRACGIAANEARHGLSAVKPVEGRMERFGGQGSPTIVVDFSHTPQALSVAIESVRVHCRGNLWVVFGCGGDRDPGKRAPMARVAEQADYIVLTDDNPRTEASEDIIAAAMKGFERPEDVIVLADRSKAIRHAVSQAKPDDLVLVAGKGHEDYQIIGNTRYPFSDREEVLAALEVAS
ncbi:MAG: UDP-N-acetylmuramoyl-L-alanyl-D-glutamate--2,6-diaminopimelate ligase [Granulosicoccus sp.]